MQRVSFMSLWSPSPQHLPGEGKSPGSLLFSHVYPFAVSVSPCLCFTMRPHHTASHRAATPASMTTSSAGPWRKLWSALGMAGLGFLLASTGCGAAPPAPALASGERPVTGEARYDRFFAEVSDLLIAVKEGEREEAEVRGALARRIGVSEQAPADVLGERLRERTARLAAEGLTMELEFTGIDDGEDEDALVEDAELAAARAANPPPANAAPSTDDASASSTSPTATLRTLGRDPEKRELRLLKVLAQAALSGATVYVDMGRVHDRTELLLAEAAKLRAGITTAFVEAAQRDRVRAKLAEAEVLLPQLSAQARAVSNATDMLIAVLDEAANTAQSAQAIRRRAAREKEAQLKAAGPPGSGGPRRPAPKERESGTAPADPPAAVTPRAEP